MANTLAEVTPKLLAQGLMALRENCVMPRLVNSDYKNQAAEKGATINIPIPSAVAAQDVTPGAYSNATGDLAPTSADIELSQWKEAPFYLTDKDRMEAVNGVIPMQASEAIKSLGNVVNAYILGKYKGIFGFAGTAGTTPFGTAGVVTDATNTRTVLNKQLAPLQDRRFVLDPDAEGNALSQRAFQDVSWAGDPGVIRDGLMNVKLGFNWHMDQQIPTHTTGAAGTVLVDQADVAAGDTAVHLDGLTAAMAVGDVFSVAGDTTGKTYTCMTAGALATNDQDITFYPPAENAWADNAAVTVKASHVVNLAFHRDCFGFASRPLADNTEGLGNLIQSAVDPVSGLALRLEISREHKRTRFSYDILYGAAMVRAELGARLGG